MAAAWSRKNDEAEGRIVLKKTIALLALFVLLLIGAGFYDPASYVIGTYFNRPGNAVPLPDRPPPHDQAEARQQDLADPGLLLRYDRSFPDAAASAFRQEIGKLGNTAGAMSDGEFEMAVSRLVALADNGHTTVDKRQRTSLFGRAPLRFAWFADGLYIVRATAGAEGLLGHRIVAIDGRWVEQALAALEPYLSGTAEHARIDSTPLLDCPPLLRAIWPDTDGEHLTVGLEDGTSVQLAAQPPTIEPFAIQPIMAIAPGGYGPDWKSVLTGYPLSLREPERVAISAPLGMDGIYVRINGNHDDAYGALPDQLAAIAATRPADGWRRMILDLRFNIGGDERKTVDFTHALPDLLGSNGNLWILTGNATFSAAIITAQRARHFLGARAHVVGATAGDHEPFWTDGGPPLVLRNARIAIGHAYFKQDWAHGCHNPAECNPLQFLYRVAVGDLTPQVKVGWSFADYAAGRDTVLEKALELSR
jgi:hypothetical protein